MLFTYYLISAIRSFLYSFNLSISYFIVAEK